MVNFAEGVSSFQSETANKLEDSYRTTKELPKKFHIDTWFPNITATIQKDGVRKTESKIPKSEIVMRFPPIYGKLDIKAFLKQVYGMKVLSVNTLNYEGKVKRSQTSAKPYRTKAYKKAYITIQGHEDVDALLAQQAKAKEKTELNAKEAEEKKKK
jgi:ribosomal protein L23